MQQAKTALTLAAKYLARTQLTGGGFYSSSSPSKQPFNERYRYETTFFPSLILSALAGDTSRRTAVVQANIADFLRHELRDQATLNYWSRRSKQYTTMPYPDDADDTFCGLRALYLHDRTFMDGTMTARVAHLLIDREVGPGGPYRTGFVGEAHDAAWQRVDLLVNANIAAFLAQDDITLEPVVALIKQAVLADDLLTPYYPDECMAAYLIARTPLDSETTQHLRALLLNVRAASGDWGSPLRTAAATVALARLGYSTERLGSAIAALLAQQQSDGGWPAAAVSIDPSRDGQTYYAGSAALTTALCYEAIMICSQRSATVRKTVRRRINQEIVVTDVQSVVATISRPELRNSVTAMLDGMRQQDKDGHITEVPWLIARGFETLPSRRLLNELSKASLWGWISYTAFDDVIDGDASARIVPAALFCNRQLTDCLHGVLPQVADFHKEVAQLLTRIDIANAWELQRCRGSVRNDTFSITAIPDYGNHWQLADRSIGHVIAAVGVLYAHDFKALSVEIESVKTFFEHYLIARQLLDEAHDWQADLVGGHVNAVAAILLNRHYRERPWTGSLIVSKTIPVLQTLFWTDLITEVCSLIGYHIQTAREALAQSLAMDSEPLLRLLTPLEKATSRTLHERSERLAFLQAF